MTQVTTLYDFEGDQDNGELSFGCGEVITVTSKDVGEGWWEGQKSDGTTGLFPETYVEEAQPTGEPVLNLPPPPTELPNMDAFGIGNNEQEPSLDDIFGLGISPMPQQQQQQQQKTQNSEESLVPIGAEKPWGNPPEEQEAAPEPSAGWADDWDNTEYVAPAQVPPSPTKSHQSMGISEGSPTKRADKKTQIKVGMNLFATFTKTPAESFVLGEARAENIPETYNIILGEVGPMWQNSPEPFSCSVSDPVKESKFSGFKSFIAYNITPSHTQVAVQRRFKHFDWLHEQLNRKYSVVISIPVLPDKQITGRYEDEFIEARRAQLQSWICRIALHPVVSRSDVFNHFITSKDDERAWKAGKRKSERDDAIGGAVLHTIEVPSNSLDLTIAEQTLETHAKFARSMDEACKNIMIIGQDQIKMHQTTFKQDHQRFGLALNALSQSFELDERPVSQPLTEALKHTGDAFETIGKLYQQQVKHDWYPFLEGINEYKGVLATFPNIFTNEKSVLDKQKEVRRLQLENKVTAEEMDDVTLRTEKVIYSVQAEVNHFQYYRVGDFANYMKDFLNAQIAFHQNIVQTLQATAEQYSAMVAE